MMPQHRDWLKGRPDAALSRPDELWSERQPLHGDYQESNLFFSGPNVVAVNNNPHL